MSGAVRRLDHVVVVVTSLDDAARAFADAGFTVTPGGRHDVVATENALVGFADGSYLELLCSFDPYLRAELRSMRRKGELEGFLRERSAVARRILPLFERDDGVADWVLCGEPLARRARALRASGAKASGPVRMARERPDGTRLEWELLLPETYQLPFWIADRTPREQRVPAGDAAAHANAARGITAVRVRAPGAALAALELGDTLGVVPRAGAHGSVLEPTGFEVEVIEGEPAGACAVRLAGCTALPDAIVSLGIEPDH